MWRWQPAGAKFIPQFVRPALDLCHFGRCREVADEVGRVKHHGAMVLLDRVDGERVDDNGYERTDQRLPAQDAQASG